ncbi:MAG TPA: protein kinase [Myxococcales bacterium]|nr:protein kinase [Myxococcales bacterium]
MPDEIVEPEEPKQLPLPKLGATLGSYKLVKLIGVGGMGRVYVAEHVRLGRKVALKLLLPEFATSPEVVQRFFNEARAVNQINHPNIVEIMDFIEDAHGFNYFIMELLDGRDLRKVREKDGPFLLGRTIAVGKQVASALAAAHGQGIVHRDIKPDNVLLCPREESPNFVKLLDFGIAKLSSGIFHEQKTRLGMVLGTPGYMSPEQAFGRPIDGRSDIYSLGVLLHWMLVDTLPAAGNLPMKSQPKDEPPPDPLTTTKRGQPIPPPLAQLIQKCLAFDPDDRVQSMERILQVLTPLAPTTIETGLPEAAAPVPTMRWGEAGGASGVKVDATLGGGAPVAQPPQATIPPVGPTLPPSPGGWTTAAEAVPGGATRLDDAASKAPVGATQLRATEGETRIKDAADVAADPSLDVLPKPTGKPWLIAVVAAVVVVGGGWVALQVMGRPPREKEPVPAAEVRPAAPTVAALPPIPAPTPTTTATANPTPSTTAAATPTTTTNPTPTATATANPTPTAPPPAVAAEPPRHEPSHANYREHHHHTGAGSAARTEGHKASDDTTILDPLAE